MATLKSALTAPEVGWKRIDNTDSKISYTGTWTHGTNASYYNSTYSQSNDTTAKIKFNFTGTKIRIIGVVSTATYTTSATIKIDNELTYTYSQIGGSVVYQALLFEKIDLSDKEHFVEISFPSAYINLDAIDIDSNGFLKAYNIYPYRYLLKYNNQLLTINGNSIEILSNDGSYVPTKNDFINKGMVQLNIPNSVVSKIPNPKVLIYTDDIVNSYSKITLSLKEKPLLHDKKILMWTDDLTKDYSDVTINGERLLKYKTKTSINGTIVKDFETEFQDVDNSYTIPINTSTLNAGINNVDVKVSQDNGTEITATSTINNIIQRNYSLQFDGTANQYISIPMPTGFTLTGKVVQIAVKPSGGSWGIRTDSGTFVTMSGSNLIIGKSQACIIDEVRIWQSGSEKTFDLKPLRGDETGLVALYRFNEFEGKKVFDSSLNNYHGDIVGATFVNDIHMSQEVYDAKITTDIPAPKVIVPKNSVYTYNFDIERPQMPSTNIDDVSNSSVLDVGTVYEFNVNKADWETFKGFDTTDDNKLIMSGNKKTKYDYDIKIAELGTYTVKSGTDVIGNTDDTASISTVAFTQAVNPYTNRITVHQEGGYDVSNDGEVLLYNLEPTLILGEVDGENYLRLQIGDPDSDKVQFKVMLNGKQIYPTVGYTDLQIPPVIFDKKLLSTDFNIGTMNTVLVYTKDEYGVESVHTITFNGDYCGLMFRDEAGSYFSSDFGDILKRLDFGVITAGRESAIKKVYVRNTLGYPVQNISVSIANGTVPTGNLVKLSKQEIPFDKVDSVTFPITLNNDEQVPFFIQVYTDVLATTDGVFTINASATPVV